jgi:hypothetical protein
MPQIRFLSIGSYVCSSLRPHQAAKGTFTPKLSNMLGTPRKGPGDSSPGPVMLRVLSRPAYAVRMASDLSPEMAACAAARRAIGTR